MPAQDIFTRKVLVPAGDTIGTPTIFVGSGRIPAIRVKGADIADAGTTVTFNMGPVSDSLSFVATGAGSYAFTTDGANEDCTPYVATPAYLGPWVQFMISPAALSGIELTVYVDPR